MITLPDPTPEERARIMRSRRSAALIHGTLGILILILAAANLSVGRREDYVYAELALGLLALFVSGFIWWRAGRTV